jgi:hypothetical protein
MYYIDACKYIDELRNRGNEATQERQTATRSAHAVCTTVPEQEQEIKGQNNSTKACRQEDKRGINREQQSAFLLSRNLQRHVTD